MIKPEDKQLKELVEEEVKTQLAQFGDVFTVGAIVMDRQQRFLDGRDIKFGRTRGTRIGTDSNEKIGFLGATPIEQQTYPTTAEEVADLLKDFGLCADGTWGGGGGQTIYTGLIQSNGTATILPSGWSVSDSGTSHYTVTHNLTLGQDGYVVVVSAYNGNDRLATIDNIGTDSFEVDTYDTSSGSGSAEEEAEDWTFIMVVDN